jgi:hypothetical protein
MTTAATIMQRLTSRFILLIILSPRRLRGFQVRFADATAGNCRGQSQFDCWIVSKVGADEGRGSGLGRTYRKARVRQRSRMENGWTLSRGQGACQELMCARAIRDCGCGRRGNMARESTWIGTDSGTLWRSLDGARVNLACTATRPLRGRRGFGCFAGIERVLARSAKRKHALRDCHAIKVNSDRMFELVVAVGLTIRRF